MFKVRFENSNEHHNLYFELLNNSVAKKWFDELKLNYEIYESERFYNYPGSHKNEDWYVNEINNQIDIVNDHDNIIKYKFDPNADQQSMNILHKQFENLRGELESRTAWYDSVPKNVRIAVDRFNVLIHEYEAVLHNNELGFEHPYAESVCTFKNRPRHTLADEDYKLFTPLYEFGTVYVNYCEVGKTILDVYFDKDHHVGDDNIRPQNYYSADFKIKFGPTVTKQQADQELPIFWKWYEQHMKERFPNKEKAAIGMITVAKIDLIKSELKGTPLEIVKYLSRYNNIGKIECIG